MAKARLILTFDYEVFGDGSGRVDCCVIKPAERLMRICEQFDARLTFFADVAELWAFEAAETAGAFEDPAYRPGAWIKEQLRSAISRQHDVQLHLHPQWLDYEYLGGGVWRLDYTQYRISSLPDVGPRSLTEVLRKGRSTLEDLLIPVDPLYSCRSFRAGGLCIQPEQRVLEALVRTGMRKDSSVMPHMSVPGDLGFDFSGFSVGHGRPYPVKDSLRTSNDHGQVTEHPICTARTTFWSNVRFFALRRYAMPKDRPDGCAGAPLAHASRSEKPPSRFLRYGKRLLPRFIPLDLTGQVLAEEMIYVLKEALRAIDGRQSHDPVPLVAIGHCKNFGDDREFIRFLQFAQGHPDVELETRSRPSLWR